jgi:hypothetical protein
VFVPLTAGAKMVVLCYGSKPPNVIWYLLSVLGGGSGLDYPERYFCHEVFGSKPWWRDVSNGAGSCIGFGLGSCTGLGANRAIGRGNLSVENALSV